jgi:hypothetical protein
VKTATPIEIRKMKENFGKKYPNATMSKFDFEVTFAKDGTEESRDIFFKVDNLTSYDITSDAFRSNPEWTKFLHWVDGWRSVLPDMIFRPNKDFKMNVHSFKVYVTETENFVTIKPTYNKPKDTFIDNLPCDYHSNSYFCSLTAAYVATFKCGISEDHLTNNLPNSHSNTVTSIVRFHLHFHLSRLMRNPKLLDQYITKDDIWAIRKFTSVHETWEKRTDSSHANLGT